MSVSAQKTKVMKVIELFFWPCFFILCFLHVARRGLVYKETTKGKTHSNGLHTNLYHVFSFSKTHPCSFSLLPVQTLWVIRQRLVARQARWCKQKRSGAAQLAVTSLVFHIVHSLLTFWAQGDFSFSKVWKLAKVSQSSHWCALSALQKLFIKSLCYTGVCTVQGGAHQIMAILENDCCTTNLNFNDK